MNVSDQSDNKYVVEAIKKQVVVTASSHREAALKAFRDGLLNEVCKLLRIRRSDYRHSWRWFLSEPILEECGFKVERRTDVMKGEA